MVLLWTVPLLFLSLIAYAQSPWPRGSVLILLLFITTIAAVIGITRDLREN